MAVACRVCGTALPAPYLDLGVQPLANASRDPFDVSPEFTAPLAVTRCSHCSLSQLTETVDPAILFHTNYAFASGVSRAWHGHCAELALFASATISPRTNSRVVLDLAANDGTQLVYFKREGWTVLGVDPAHVPPVPVGTHGNEVQASVPMLHGFWPDPRLIEQVAVQVGPVDLIVAQNVFGHVPDPVGFLVGCREVLSPSGRIAIEVPHVGELIARTAFDTIYHEHLSYWSLHPLLDACRRAGLAVERVERLDVHGGSRRYWLGHVDRITPDRTVGEELASEQWIGLDRSGPYAEFALRTYDTLAETIETLQTVAGGRVWAFGASAKGTVMLNALKAHGNRVWPDLILDETPGKIGRVSAGLGIPIARPPASLVNVDVLWLLSWNWAETLMGKAKALGFRGRFLVTAPDVALIEADDQPDCVPVA